jgi:hypothetical protein
MRNHHDAKGPTLKTTRGRHLPRPYGRPTGWLRFVFAGLSPCANRDSLVGSRDTTPLGYMQQRPLTRSMESRLPLPNELERVNVSHAAAGDTAQIVPKGRSRRLSFWTAQGCWK